MIGRKDKNVQAANPQRLAVRQSSASTETPDAALDKSGRTRRPGAANIGRSITIKGELSGSEDLTIEGTLEGKVTLAEHRLTIGAEANVVAEVMGKRVSVFGKVVGNVTATERIEVADGGSVQGDLCAPKVVLAEGARVRGAVDTLSTSRTGSAATPQAGWDRDTTASPASLSTDSDKPSATTSTTTSTTGTTSEPKW